MKLKPKLKRIKHLNEIEPHIEHSQRHKLIDVLTIAILAVIFEADRIGGSFYRFTLLRSTRIHLQSVL